MCRSSLLYVAQIVVGRWRDFRRGRPKQVVLDVVPRRLVHLDVVARVPLVRVVVGVAVLALVQMQLGFDDVDALESRCRVGDCGLLQDLDARLIEEYSMLGYLSRRWCRRSVDSSGSVLSRMTW